MSSIFRNNVKVKENLKKYLKDFYRSNDYSREAGTNTAVKYLLVAAMDFADDLEDTKKDIKEEIDDINKKLDKIIDLLKTLESRSKPNSTNTISVDTDTISTVADWDKNREPYEEVYKSIIDRQKARYYEG